MKRRIAVLLCMCCAVSGLLQACTFRQTDARELLERLLSTQGEVPAGRCYTLSSSFAEDETADEALLTQLFGREGRLPAALALPLQGAFFLSAAAPFELMVFQCADRGDAQKVAALCLERRQALCSFWLTVESASQETGEESACALPPGGVTVRGRWVLFYLCPQEKACLRTFQRSV